MLSPRIRNGIIVLVSAMWAISTGISWVNEDFHKDPALDAAFGLVVGLALGVGKKEDDDSDDAPRKGPR